MIREHGEPLAITIDFPQVGMELLHGHNDATGARGKAAAPIGLRQGQVTLEPSPLVSVYSLRTENGHEVC